MPDHTDYIIWDKIVFDDQNLGRRLCLVLDKPVVGLLLCFCPNFL